MEAGAEKPSVLANKQLTQTDVTAFATFFDLLAKFDAEDKKKFTLEAASSVTAAGGVTSAVNQQGQTDKKLD